MSFASDFKSQLSHMKALILDQHEAFDPKAATARDALISFTEFLDKEHAEGRFCLTDVVGTVFGHISYSNDDHLRDAALKIAREIDKDDGGHAYHNALHFAKVLTNAFALVYMHNQNLPRSQWLQPEDIAQLLLAAVAHDFGHNGKGNKGQTFKLEQHAITEASKICNGAKPGFDLIYATDVNGHPSPASLVRAAYDHYYNNGPAPVIPPEMEKQLRPIIRDKKRTLLASLLMDADILSPVLSEERSLKESVRVATEFGTEPTLKSSMFFLQTLLGGRVTTHAAQAVVGSSITDMLIKFKAFIERGREPAWPKIAAPHA